MADQFVPPPSKAGNYVKLSVLAASGDVIALTPGFSADDEANTYQGKPSPRYILKGRNLTSDADVTISSPKLTTSGEPNGRTEFVEALEKFFATHADAVVAVRFTETPGSAYVGMEVVEQ